MKKPVLVGIDVSADSFAAAWGGDRDGPQTADFANTPTGHRKFCRKLHQMGAPVRVCLEATGVYSFDLAMALHQAKGIEVMVANPRATKDFRRACMTRAKTDRTDALSILEFVRRMSFEPWRPPSPEALKLRAISRRIATLVHHRIQERNRLKMMFRTQQLADVLGPAIEEHVEYLEQAMAHLKERALEIIASDRELRRRHARLVSVKGISDASAIRILSELATLPEGMTARQWVAHAGLDPRPFESGTSVNKPTRISKTGNRHIRAALYMPALVAIRYDPNIQAFYQALILRGKKPLQGIVAVMRKLLHAIHGMFANDQDFVGERFFRLSA